MQLNRYLALCGLASRRKANDIINEGRVRVNRETVTTLGVQIDPEKDMVDVDGKEVVPESAHAYVLLNKPAGTLTSVSDDRGRKTVIDLVGSNKRLFPVGRLDFDTEGVLLLTDDGDLSYRLMHPKYEIRKVYRAWVKGRMTEEALQTLRTGVTIEEDVTVSGEVSFLKAYSGKSLVEITIHEGRKRQVKYMLRAVGFHVLYLERTYFAGLTVSGLKRGEWRELTQQEINRLYHITGLKEDQEK